MKGKTTTAKEFEKFVNDPETIKRVTATYQELLEELRRGLPPATSGELLNSKVDF